MHGRRIVYVLAGVAGLRYVERRGLLFRTFQKMRVPREAAFPPVHGGTRAAHNFRNFPVPTLQEPGLADGLDGFDSLILVAPPILSEALLSCLPATLRKKALACIERDLSRIQDRELPRYLPLHLVHRSDAVDARQDPVEVSSNTEAATGD